jgi:hypothetical protein
MNTDETINKEELTLQNTPKAVNYLINEIAEMRVLLEHIESQLGNILLLIHWMPVPERIYTNSKKGMFMLF